MRKFPVAVCAATVLSLLLGACTGGDVSTAPPKPVANSGAIITYSETEPANALVPGNTTEVGGISILGALFRGLLEFDATTAAPRNAVAESITTSDSKVWTIKIKPNWKFQGGDSVTAKSFVDAWNYTAYSPNLMKSASYMAHIQGFDQVNNATPDGKQPGTLPPAKELSGLKIVDDHTFTVTLDAPFSQFYLRLGYAAFYPMPPSFFADRKAFEAHPVGNGPFEFVSYAKGKNLLVKRFDGFSGERKPQIGGIDYRFYADLDQAYADVLADKLDFLSFTPWRATQGNQIDKDLPPSRRTSYKYLGYQSIAFPMFDSRYASRQLRQAISMAIDRPALIQQIFNGGRVPADGLVPPNVQGYVPNQCGELCTYQPQKAKQLFDAVGFAGPITLTSNVDSGNREWVEVVCQSIERTLAHPCVFQPQTTLGEFRTALNNRSITAAYRTAWVAGFPSVENFLNPLFRTNGASNVGQYSNQRVDDLLTRADAAPSREQANSLYQEAERVVLQDMQTIPIWYQSATAAWSSRLHDVHPTLFRELDFYSVTVSK
ncbi:peptide ABC transporter substrate-binding protein [Longispora fulva]|uniref:Oligopeptide transport system substrate-binding protein n=1 Tax=Longispora fulva TaxID=619741 RepID=A0A8J7GR78_9ACTN|nr:ABC transporter substrate-binding protein [Longispora fulva]MBG6136678.1 oligopeptide transport system substrate-binding protein [Longispora fulva]GIG59847.1 peptide ABC transporter substrate-binding protein [Longispora fulva]